MVIGNIYVGKYIKVIELVLQVRGKGIFSIVVFDPEQEVIDVGGLDQVLQVIVTGIGNVKVFIQAPDAFDNIGLKRFLFKRIHFIKPEQLHGNYQDY
jgi:hypothetical protein